MSIVDENSVKELQKLIDKVNKQNLYSAFTYLSWSTFGLTITYEYDANNECIYFPAQIHESYWEYTNQVFHYELAKDVNERHLILSPIIKDPNKFLTVLKHQVDAIMNSHACMGVLVNDLTNEQYEQVQQHYETKLIFKTVSNFLYPREQLQFMSGNKMQKKRNHLNFYLKNFAFKSHIKKISEIPFHEIEQYLQQWGDENDKFNHKSELDFVKKCQHLIADQTLKGIGLYLDNQLIGLTISYEHGDYCEILIEHANKTIRGSYQYLLSQNLGLNHSQSQIVDRQDDVLSAVIYEAKRRYKPSAIIEKNFILILKPKC